MNQTRLSELTADFLASPDKPGRELSFGCTEELCQLLIERIAELEAEAAEVNADFVLMPRELTAENGAKAMLIGEFSVPVHVACPDCDGERDSYVMGCELCDGSGLVLQSIPVPWPTIKQIYVMAVKHLAKETR